MKPRRALFALTTFVVAASACGRLEPLSTQRALERLSVATSKVYDSDGHVIANLHGEVNRDIARLGEIPKHVRDAVVAIEDERFWIHQGVDLRSITRAAVANFRSGRADGTTPQLQGGSTISQQLAKNLYFPRPARTLGRKLAEARVTYELEREYSKPKILEMYLNTIYLGRGAYGIETAARSYFGRSASKLSLGEGAFLAGLIHEPGRYEWSATDPAGRQAERRAAARGRRNYVLRRMERLGMVSAISADAAQRAPLRVKPPGEYRWRHPYFVDLVLRELGVLRNSRSQLLDPRFNFLGTTFRERSRNVYRRGLRIYTTLDPNVQRAAERAVKTVLPKDLDKLSAALVAIEPSTGYLRALVGGRNYYPKCAHLDAANLPQLCRLAKVNLALGNYGGGSGRQPGSAFKPFVLTAALERGIPLSRVYSGSPFSYAYTGSVWKVSNYDGASGGSRTLLDGIVHSVNAVYAHAEIEGVGDGDGLKGAARVAGLARRMGIGFPTPEQLKARCGSEYFRTDTCLPADSTPAVALGAKEVSPLDMASAYSTFANDGVRMLPTAIVRITDGRGRELYRAKPDGRRVLPAGIARGVTYALTQVMKRGTATRAQIDRPAAAKTGTSQQWRDAWLAGFVPQLAAVVWVGNPIPRPYGGVESMTPANGYPFRVVGGTLPAMTWRAFMTDALRGLPARDFPLPPAVLLRPEFVLAPNLETPDPDADINTDDTVPDVVGSDVGDATADLQSSGYRVLQRSGCDPSGFAFEDEVFAQSPAGNTHAPKRTTVTITYQDVDCPVD